MSEQAQPFYFVFNSYEEAEQYMPSFESDDAKALRQRAEDKKRREEESFQRCDTDGCVSQWCLSIGAEEDRREAELANSARLVIRPALIDVESGEIVAGCLHVNRNRFASWERVYQWKVYREIRKDDGRVFNWFWLSDFKREANFGKRGLRKVYVMAPGKMYSRAPGNNEPEERGLSGLASYSGKFAAIDYEAAGLPL